MDKFKNIDFIELSDNDFNDQFINEQLLNNKKILFILNDTKAFNFIFKSTTRTFFKLFSHFYGKSYKESDCLIIKISLNQFVKSFPNQKLLDKELIGYDISDKNIFYLNQ